tara:strand:+ start:1378 stop:1608 length:231 start_codon:yes stop_codon:yes gene_type:complete
MSEIITCKEFNRRGFNDYKKACNEWNPSNGGFPYIGFYIFEKPNGEPRNYGYVLATQHGGEWFKTKKEAYRRKAND